MQPEDQITENAYEKHAWIIFLAGGILILIMSLNFLAFPYYDPHWDSYTSHSKGVIRMLSPAALGFPILTIAVSVTSYRRGEKWSWYTLWYLPVFWGLMALVLTWMWAVPAILAIISLLGLILPYRKFFPKEPAESLKT